MNGFKVRLLIHLAAPGYLLAVRRGVGKYQRN